MEFEDSRNALFCDPNAYIQKVEKRDKCEPRKVVFQEPYEQLPNFYLDNNFKRGDCDCIQKKKDTQKQDNQTSQNLFGFDLKNLMPILGMFNKSGGADFSQIAKLLNNSNNSNAESSNPMSMIFNLLSNSGGLTNILNLFKGGIFNKKQATKKEIKSTDFQIKNYTRVE